MLKKLPVNLSNEDLIKDLDSSPIPLDQSISLKSKREDSVIKFLQFYNIEPGKHLMKTKTLYGLYKKFIKDPLTRQSFCIQMNKFLNLKSLNDTRETYYLINQKALNISEKALSLLGDDLKQLRFKNKARQHFESFIERYNIKPGNEDSFIWLSYDVLYDLYDEWTYNNSKRAPLSKKHLRKICGMYFPEIKKMQYKDWFYIDASITKFLTADRISDIQARTRLKHEKKKQKKQR